MTPWETERLRVSSQTCPIQGTSFSFRHFLALGPGFKEIRKHDGARTHICSRSIQSALGMMVLKRSTNIDQHSFFWKRNDRMDNADAPDGCQHVGNSRPPFLPSPFASRVFAQREETVQRPAVSDTQATTLTHTSSVTTTGTVSVLEGSPAVAF